MSAHFSTYFKYQAWANQAFCQVLAGLEPSQQAEQRVQTIQLMNHLHVVLRIFAAHLQGLPHDYQTDFPAQIPELETLRADLAEIDGWYLVYVQRVTQEELAEPYAFTFTDGDVGSMSREEMLSHVVLHSVYHRGEIGRILKQIGIRPPGDTFARFLHQSQPARRQQGKF